jgi:hypothetical protein
MKLSQTNDMITIKSKIIHDITNFKFNKSILNKIRDMNKDDIIDILLASIAMTESLQILLED